MQERRRFVGRLELRLELLSSSVERLHLGFALGHVDLVVEQQVPADVIERERQQMSEIAFGRTRSRSLLGLPIMIPVREANRLRSSFPEAVCQMLAAVDVVTVR